MDFTMSAAGIVYKLVEEGKGLHAEEDIAQRATGGMTDGEYTRAKRALVRLGLITEIRRTCGGSTIFQLESLSCQRTPFDDDDTGKEDEEALYRQPSAMDRTFGIDATTTPIKSVDFADSFWQQIDVCDKEECWEWRGLTTSKGYGRVRFNQGDTTAHRVAFQLHTGHALTSSDRVKQTCGNKLCCNPHHLTTDAVPTLMAWANGNTTVPNPLGTALGTGNSDGNWPPTLSSSKEDLNSLEEENTLDDAGDVVSEEVNNSDDTSIPPSNREEINLSRIHKLSSVSEKQEESANTPEDGAERDWAVVGWNEPPAYWPEECRNMGQFLVMNRPAPLGRGFGGADRSNKSLILPIGVMNSAAGTRDFHTGFWVCDDGYVITLWLDYYLGGLGRKQVRPKFGWDDTRWRELLASGFDKYADYVGEMAVPTVPEVPEVPTPTGTAKAVDNSDLLSTLPRFHDVPVLPDGENDLFGGPAWAYAEEIIRRFRAQQPVKQWHPLIGPYPVPEWAEEAASFVTGKHYWELEVAVGQKLEEASSKSAEFHVVRAFVNTCLDRETDPLDIAKTWGGRINDPTSFVASATYRMGGKVPNIPNTPRPVLLPVAPLGLVEPEVLEVGDHFPKASAPSTSSPVVYRVKRW